MDPSRELGLSEDATAAEIKLAHRRLAVEHHPDRNPGSATAAARSTAINVAFEMVRTPEVRAATDARLRRERAAEAAEVLLHATRPTAPVTAPVTLFERATVASAGAETWVHIASMALGFGVDAYLAKKASRRTEDATHRARGRTWIPKYTRRTGRRSAATTARREREPRVSTCRRAPTHSLGFAFGGGRLSLSTRDREAPTGGANFFPR